MTILIYKRVTFFIKVFTDWFSKYYNNYLTQGRWTALDIYLDASRLSTSTTIQLPFGDSCIIWKRARMKREVFYLVCKWDDNLVFNSRHLLIHLYLVSTLSQLLIVSPAKISEFKNLLPRPLVDEASSTRDLGARLRWISVGHWESAKKERRRDPAILTEQPRSIKDLLHGQKGNFFSCGTTAGNPEGAR